MWTDEGYRYTAREIKGIATYYRAYFGEHCTPRDLDKKCDFDVAFNKLSKPQRKAVSDFILDSEQCFNKLYDKSLFNTFALMARILNGD